MIHTKLLRSGSSQAVQIPAELAYRDWDVKLEVEREGDEIRIRPMRPRGRLADLLAALTPLAYDFKVPGRSGVPLPDHDELVDEVRAAP